MRKFGSLVLLMETLACLVNERTRKDYEVKEFGISQTLEKFGA